MKIQYQKERSDCGCACLDMILENFGIKMPYAAVADAVDADKNGTSIYGVCKGAEKFGLNAEGLEGSLEDLLSSIKKHEIHFPFIARTVNKAGYSHFVIVKSVTQDRFYIYDPDPEIGKIHYSKNDFQVLFQGQIITFTKGENFRKRNERKSPLLKFIKESINFKILAIFGAISIINILITLIGMTPAFLLNYLSDYVTSESEESLDFMAVAIAICFIMYIIRLGLNFIRGKLTINISWKINENIIKKYYDKMLHLPISWMQKKENADITTRFSDGTKIVDAITNVFMILTFDSIMVFCSGILLHSISHTIFHAGLFIIFTNIIISFIYIKPINNAEKEVIYNNVAFNSYLKQSIDGILTIKSLNAEKQVNARFIHLFDNLKNSSKKAIFRNINKNNLLEATNSINTLAIFWIIAMEIYQGHSIGSCIAAYTLMGYFTEPVLSLSELHLSLTEASQAAERLEELYSTPPEPDNIGTEQIKNGEIIINNISFAYGYNEEIIKDMTLKIEPEINMCITGASGTGKSTIAKLLNHLLVPNSGEIFISGKPAECFSIHEIRKNIQYIPQKQFFFSGTLRENLLLGNSPDITNTQIMTVLRQIDADFVKKEEELYIMVQEGGKNFSGGQLQKLAIARALLRNPKILVLDEVTAQIDSNSRDKIRETVANLKGITKIWISHDPAIIKKADKIYTLKKISA